LLNLPTTTYALIGGTATIGPERLSAAAQQFGRIRTKASIEPTRRREADTVKLNCGGNRQLRLAGAAVVNAYQSASRQ
jgi:hypothetical protein